jgi:hypothetical protein
MRVARDAFFARTALERGRRLLGPAFGLADAAHGEHVGAVAAAEAQRDAGILSGLGGRITLTSEEVVA